MLPASFETGRSLDHSQLCHFDGQVNVPQCHRHIVGCSSPAPGGGLVSPPMGQWALDRDSSRHTFHKSNAGRLVLEKLRSRGFPVTGLVR